jgi:hypothetical protein
MTRRKQHYLASFSPFPDKHNNGAAARSYNCIFADEVLFIYSAVNELVAQLTFILPFCPLEGLELEPLS